MYDFPSMYAIISTGGKQEKVAAGERIAVERLGAAAGEEVTFTPVLLVDDTTVVTDSATLSNARVVARVVDEVKGPKIRAFTYKPKSNNRRRWGHRQAYSLIEVTEISGGK